MRNETVQYFVEGADEKVIVDVLKNELKEYGYATKIICVPQIPNLEGELIYSCNIRKITELLNSKSEKEFKSDLIHITNLGSKLKEHEFDIGRMWSRQGEYPYQKIINEAEKIKLKND